MQVVGNHVEREASVTLLRIARQVWRVAQHMHSQTARTPFCAREQCPLTRLAIYASTLLDLLSFVSR